MKKQIVIVSGFSGVGKRTLLKRVLHQLPDAELVRSCTTRTQRNDDDYYTFLSDDEFSSLISENAFLEYNCYSGKFYGTPVSEVTRILREGKLPIAEIEPNGFIQVIQSGYFDRTAIHSIFIADDVDSILKKLLGRNSESKEKIISRFNSAIEESKMVMLYDQILINENLETATKELFSFITTFRGKDVMFDDTMFRVRLQEIINDLMAN